MGHEPATALVCSQVIIDDDGYIVTIPWTMQTQGAGKKQFRTLTPISRSTSQQRTQFQLKLE